MLRRIALFGALAITACGPPNYVYEPAAHATAQLAGRTAANYQIPPEMPQGDVRITTFGIVNLRPHGAPKHAALRALHVRMVAANNSDQAWTFDTRQQRAVLANHSQSRAAFASVPGGGAPTVRIEPGGSRTFNLFFPLPVTMQNAARIPQFDVIWQIQTGSRLVTERTPFERFEIVPYYDYPDPYFTYGAFYYDPYYPHEMFNGTGALPPSYMQRPVVIEAPPTGRVR